MDELATHLWTEAVSALEQLPEDARSDTYVVSFFVYDENDDPRRPTVTIGTNTERQAALSVGTPEEDEARWNFAFWLQNDLAILGDSRSDPLGAELRDEWVRTLGVSLDDDDNTFGAASPITEAFVGLCIEIVQRLHREGVVVATFGRSLPVLIHELEYHDQIAEQNLAANPPGVADDFASWVGSA